MKITKHSAVSIHYRLTDAHGELIEDSFSAEPMQYLHGTQNMIPGLEAELENKSVGDKLDVVVKAKDGYGEHNDALTQEVPISAFGDVKDIVPGMRFIAETDNGEMPVRITEVNDDSVIVDGNHPLAGQDLSFHVEIMSVREGTSEEISHGHIHADGASCSH
ncbi:peptidylprolyl isomerase [Shewanella sp. OPT22]|nr:peptidylprolyl isomerase [Shewanella sp. OPT22]